MYHVSVEQMRLIEWARSWNWAVRFPDFTTPSDFLEWFPATDVTYSIFQVEKQDFTAGLGAFDIPKSTGIHQVSLTCYDGSRRKGDYTNVLQLHKWIKAWGEDIVNLSIGVRTLTEACRPMEIIHYNSLSNKIGKVSYAVFPHGEINFIGGSEADINKLELTFSIAGVTVEDTSLEII